MSEITDLFAGVAVSDLDISIDWYKMALAESPNAA